MNEIYSRVLAISGSAQLLFEGGVLAALSPAAARLLPQAAVGMTGEAVLGAEFAQGRGLFSVEIDGNSYDVALSAQGDLCMATLTPAQQEITANSLLAVSETMRRHLATLFSVTPKVQQALDESDPEVMTWAAQMNQSHYALMRLSGNISAYAGGDLSLRPSRLDLDFWLQAQLRVWESLTQAAGRTLDYRGTPEPCYCTIDPDAMERALLNLLSNAIKFSPAGSTITLSLRQKRDRVTLTLRDQGCGIPADQLATIFHRSASYSGLHDPRSSTGMGLAIAKSIVEAHGGRLMVESQENQGTAVHIALSAQRSVREKNLASGLSQPDYAGGVDHRVLELSDALPCQVFDSRELD